MASLPANSTWNSSTTTTSLGSTTSGWAARRSASLVTPACLSPPARRFISRTRARSTASPYSRSDSIPTVCACGTHEGSTAVGVNSTNDTPSLKSSRYMPSSAGAYREASAYSRTSSTFVLPAPERPPSSRCGVASSSDRVNGSRPSRPTMARSPYDSCRR